MAPLNLTGIFLPALMTTVLRSKLEQFPETKIGDSYDYIIILFNEIYNLFYDMPKYGKSELNNMTDISWAYHEMPMFHEMPEQIRQIYSILTVGSGYGGSVVANRLSENPEDRVLLLEAGSKDNVSSQVPLLSMALMREGYDWKYDTIPQKKACFGMDDKSCKLSSGKVVGGSSVLDLLIYFRGHRKEFDQWEKQGNPGWSYDEMLPFFKKSEDYRIDGDCIENEFHSCGGELFIGSLPKGADTEPTRYLMKAAKEMGFDEIDCDGPKQIGVSQGHFTIRNGVRQSAATAFLRPVMQRSNLHISLDSFVHRIIIDPETKTAIGVELEKEGKLIQIKAKKEVILSAGIYSSPKILMLSGIGPKEELEKFNIPVLADVPGVGQNLQEKISSVVLLTKDEILSEERQSVVSTTTIREWNKGTGLMASPSGIDSFILMRSKYAESDPEIADIMVLLQSLPIYAITEPFVKKSYGFSDKYWEKHYATYVDKEAVILHPLVLIPKSKGSVTIRSNDPHDHPVIDPNFYAEEIDKKVHIDAIQKSMAMVNTTVFKGRNYHILSIPEEECEQYKDPLSDEHISCMLKYSTLSKWCGCCTNKMGPESDPMTVVDHRLRVRGVKHLRIADASAIPQQYSGLPGAAVIMIGEKAAHMIKEDNN